MKSAKLLLASLVWFTLCSGQNQYIAFHGGTDMNVYLAGTLQSVAQINNAPPGVSQVLHSPDGTKVYLLANGSGAALTALDGEFRNPRAVGSNFAAAPTFATFQPDGRRLIVLAGRVYFVDTATDTVLNPSGLVVAGTPFDVAVSFDSTTAFVLSRTGSAGVATVLTRIDLETGNASLDSLPFLGNQTEFATGIVLAPNGKLYLSAYARIYEIDPETMRVTSDGEIPVRAHPNRGVATPDGRYLVFPNRQPLFGGNSIVQFDLLRRELLYDAASTGEVFANLIPASLDSNPPKMYAHAANGGLYDLTLGQQVILERAAIGSRNALAVFRQLAFSNEVPPLRMWFPQTGGSPLKLVQAGITLSDQTTQEVNLPFPGSPALSAGGPAVFSGGVRILGYNTSQVAAAGARVALPLVARVIDRFGRPVFRSQLQFTASNPAVVLQNATMLTGNQGFGQTFVTAPATPGVYKVTASAGSGVTPFEFTITVPGGDTLWLSAGDNQLIHTNATLPILLTVRVLNAALNPVEGRRVFWTVSPPGAGSFFATSETVTLADGFARNVFRSSGYVGKWQVRASLDSGTPMPTVVFQVETEPTVIGSIVVLTSSAQSAAPGNEYRETLDVLVRNPAGRVLSDIPVNFATSGGGVVLSSSSAVTDRFGVASIRVRAGSTLGTYTVTASAGGVQSGQARFTVVSPVSQRFVPLAPCRALDTRDFGGPLRPRVVSGVQPRCADLDFASAHSLNVTVIPRGPLSFLTLWPSGFLQPAVSTLNSLDGRIKANAAIAVGRSFNMAATDTTDVVLDQNGYFLDSLFAGTDALMFYPIAPCRLFDTRTTSTPLTPRETRNFTLTNCINSQVPVGAVSLNATVIPRGGAPFGFLTLWPDGLPQPTVSTLNALTGTVTANAAIVQVPSNGILKMFGTDAADVVMDVNGFFGPPSIAAIPNGAMHFYPITPCRISDTRLAAGPFGGPVLAAAAARTIPVPQSECGIPANAAAYVLNATVVPNGVFGFLTLWPSGLERPVVSTLNAVDGFVTSNMAIVRAGTNGSINVFGSNAAHVVLDISGYFAP